MLYLLAQKHGLHVGKDESAGGTDSDSQSGHHHRHHDSENRTSSCHHSHSHDEAGSSKKKLVSSRSCSVSGKTVHNQNVESKCKHQIKETVETKSSTSNCPLQRSATLDIHKKLGTSESHPIADIEREDGEKPKPESAAEKLKTECKGKVVEKQTSSENLLAKRKRWAHNRSATCADPS